MLFPLDADLTATILFVDDDPLILTAMRRTLARTTTWDLRFTTEVNEAVAQIKSGEIHLVVSDVQMPGGGGFRVLEAAAASAHQVPVIMVTGAGDRDLRSRALELGATDLLRKPVERDELMASIRNALRLRAHQERLLQHNQLLEEMVAQRTQALERSHHDLVLALARASHHRDGDTGDHVVRVGRYAALIASAVGLDEQTSRTLLLAAPLHDVGKIGIPDAILTKPGKLTVEEFAVMKRHCEIGAQILSSQAHCSGGFDRWQSEATLEDSVDSPMLQMAQRIALAHHERWDGTGYPLGLRGDEIPIEARITAVADVYDALAEARAYKPAFPESEVLNLLRGGRGSQFDPAVLDAFESVLPELRRIAAESHDPADRLILAAR